MMLTSGPYMISRHAMRTDGMYGGNISVAPCLVSCKLDWSHQLGDNTLVPL
jgi:hypothetical protein